MMGTLQKINTTVHFIKGFLYEDALVTLKINLFINFVVLSSCPLNVLSVRGNRDAVITDRLTAPPVGPHQNDNVIMSKDIMFTLLLLINNVDDGVNKGYCGILFKA